MGERQVLRQVDRRHRRSPLVHEGGDEQHHPVGGIDGEQAAPGVTVEPRQRRAVGQRPGEGQVQQVAGDDEQHRDADVEASSETAEAVNAGHRHRRPEGHGEHCQQCEAGQRATLGVGMIAVEATAVGALPPR